MCCSFICAAMNAVPIAWASDKVSSPPNDLRSECANLPRPNIPEYARADYGSTVYKAATYYIFLEKGSSAVNLSDYDPELNEILRKIHEPKYFSRANDSLESNMKEGMSDVVGTLGQQPDKVYFNRAMICTSLNAYTKKGSSENIYAKYTFQQIIDQIDSDSTDTTQRTENNQVKAVIQDKTNPVASKSNSSVKKTAEPSDPNTQFLVGMNYETGKDGTHNAQQAMYWFRKSAEQGNGRAQYWLASHYLTGDGVPKDITQAYAWFSASAANGYFPAENPRNLCGEMLSKVDLAKAQAVANYYHSKYRSN